MSETAVHLEYEPFPSVGALDEPVGPSPLDRRASAPHRNHRPRALGGLWNPQARRGEAGPRSPKSNSAAMASARSNAHVGSGDPPSNSK